MQLIGTVLPIFHTQDWVQQIFVVLIALGFPVALALGWIFDLRLSGLRKTTVAGVPQTTDHRRLWILTGTGLLIAGIALAGYWLWHPWTRHSRDLPVAELPRPETSAAPVILEKSVAVLPFLNASDDKTNAQFVDGVHDEILTDLAKVRALKVISRTSTMQYR